MDALSLSFFFLGMLGFLFCHPVGLWENGIWGPAKGNGEVEKVLKETQKQAQKAKEKVEAVPLVCQCRDVRKNDVLFVQWFWV